ncbi:Endonuclease/Exonuclease/phosphatase family protein [Aquisphaera giovannonii]|uniref:Endonuclease/Exonuclease/phosphatase family protein n=1 Tax=Aquisphaera giovannonii TaxID=406548 RepID=A0A5B9WEL5_9BACT|nr:endonuclease/exonuclease/phosphatase family protein [Aquisphaera giovannonii]QEH38913.1 Endonuclease/Exonuclease/phosphatase family protein [Aquisphaera giovannonii]
MSMTDKGPLRYRLIDGVATPVLPEGRRSPSRMVRRGTAIACWAYAATLLGAWAIARLSPASSWPVHLLLYGPAWVAALPAVVLIPLVAWLRRPWSAAAVGLGLVGFVGVSGFNVPWGTPLASPPRPGEPLRVLTCNVQGKDLKADVLATLIREARPDVICLQECTLSDPIATLGLEGWQARTAGEHCLASRFPIEEFAELRRPDKSYRIIAVRARLVRPGGDVPIASVHLLTPRRGLEPLVETKVTGLAAFREIAATQSYESELLRRWVERAPESLVLAGDFNLTAEQPLFRRDWSSYRDAFAWTGWGLGHTMFTRLIGLRIDHVLCGSRWLPRSCAVGPDVGSAHRPVVVELAPVP